MRIPLLVLGLLAGCGWVGSGDTPTREDLRQELITELNQAWETECNRRVETSLTWAETQRLGKLADAEKLREPASAEAWAQVRGLRGQAACTQACRQLGARQVEYAARPFEPNPERREVCLCVAKR